MSTSPTTKPIPAVLQFWYNLSNSLPQVTLPLGPKWSFLNFSVTVATVLVLLTLNQMVEQVLIHVVGFPVDEQGRALVLTAATAASLVSIFHSVNLVVALLFLFFTQRFEPSAKLQEAEPWWQTTCHAILQFCTGYMIYDSIMMFLRAPKGLWLSEEDIMFFGHHIATILYMSSTRMVGAGHFSAMICMLTGEFTNPFHNAYYVARNALSLDCCNGMWVQHFDYVNTFLFSLTYCIFRTLVCPAFSAYILYDSIVRGWKNVPVWILVVWNLLIWAVLLGSIPWIIDCWNMLTPYFKSTGVITTEL